MKQLTDADIAQMAGNDFVPDCDATRRRVHSELKLSTRIPPITKNIYIITPKNRHGIK